MSNYPAASLVFLHGGVHYNAGPSLVPSSPTYSFAMFLYVARHAWAGQVGNPGYSSDAERPLTPEGRERYARVIARLKDRDFRPAVIATSPLVRCVQTAEIMAEGTGGDAEIVPLDALLPKSDLQSLLKWTRDQQERDVAWVGHAPDVSNLTSALIGERSAWVRFAKGTIAAVRFDDIFQAGQGELHWLVTAKILGC